eukprot:scaffold131_cov34-Prasinocladus_malaysianus.AAC.2
MEQTGMEWNGMGKMVSACQLVTRRLNLQKVRRLQPCQINEHETYSYTLDHWLWLCPRDYCRRGTIRLYSSTCRSREWNVLSFSQPCSWSGWDGMGWDGMGWDGRKTNRVEWKGLYWRGKNQNDLTA